MELKSILDQNTLVIQLIKELKENFHFLGSGGEGKMGLNAGHSFLTILSDSDTPFSCTRQTPNLSALSDLVKPCFAIIFQ